MDGIGNGNSSDNGHAANILQYTHQRPECIRVI